MIVFEIYLNLFDLEFSVLFFYKEKYTRPKNWTHLRGFARPTTPDRNQARNRHFSHVTKSRIFKILNLRKKADRNFRRTFLKNRFRHLNYIQIPQADCPEVVVIWAPFERQKIEVHIFERANLSGFG